MDSLSLAERIDQHFPLPHSNRGFRPSEFRKTLILMPQEGRFHLDAIRHLQDDEALRTVLGLNKLSRATTLGVLMPLATKQTSFGMAMSQIVNRLFEPTPRGPAGTD